MSSSLWTGTSGLAASEKQLSVIGNNLANANTVGFKASDTSFASMLSQSSGGSSERVGQGVTISGLPTNFSQGSFQTTGSAMDIAIDGTGFFILKNTEGSTYYTRAGAFNLTKDNVLCDNNGYIVQGYMFDSATGEEVKTAANIELQEIIDNYSSASVSKSFTAGVVLDSTTATLGKFSVAQDLYDTQGIVHPFNITFTKQAAVGNWTLGYTLDGVAATGSLTSVTFGPSGTIASAISGGLGAIIPLGNQTVQFAASAVNAPTLGALGNNNVTWTLGTGAPTMTTAATTSSISSQANDGYGYGKITSFNVKGDGLVEGVFSNGNRYDLARILLRSFDNMQALTSVGSYYLASSESGGDTRIPGTGVGALQSGSLEMSNTDVAAEFIKMIMAQRAYQANAKIITTSDQMMQQLMAVKQ